MRIDEILSLKKNIKKIKIYFLIKNIDFYYSIFYLY
jgi:hypothetical protein